ncbi:MAG: aminotransferase class I/II-fold pyridoxal phosphate-dependent enzyme [Brachybacterium sp.]|nr:aminotransferase class I/II-fold pyridoxal phosphate-dependent enzyme [Brachybacterium sp.]
MIPTRIPLAVPTTGRAEQDALRDALDSGWVAPVGPHLGRFEEALAERTGRARAVAVSSGTAALHLQLLAAGVGSGDVVLCPTLTFVATANAIRYTGAEPLLVDCGSDGCLDPGLVEDTLDRLAQQGRPAAAVMPVDVYGRIADHERIGVAADRHGATLLVDAAESLGSARGGRPAGSDGRAAGLSFNGNKIITTSSGGAVVTDDEDLADRVRHLATQAREPVPHYLHVDLGYNYRLSNLLAALGLAQLARLEEFLAARRGHRERYRRLVGSIPGLSILGEDDGWLSAASATDTGRPEVEDNCWMTVLVLDDALAAAAGEESAASLAAHLGGTLARAGIETRPLFTPLHTQPLYAATTDAPGQHALTGRAEDLFDRCLVVPSSPASSARDIDEVCERIATALESTGALQGAGDPVHALERTR